MRALNIGTANTYAAVGICNGNCDKVKINDSDIQWLCCIILKLKCFLSCRQPAEDKHAQEIGGFYGKGSCKLRDMHVLHI